MERGIPPSVKGQGMHMQICRVCRTVGPLLAASLEPLAHHRHIARLSLFYRYYFDRCSSELAQLIQLPFS